MTTTLTTILLLIGLGAAYVTMYAVVELICRYLDRHATNTVTKDEHTVETQQGRWT